MYVAVPLILMFVVPQLRCSVEGANGATPGIPKAPNGLTHTLTCSPCSVLSQNGLQWELPLKAALVHNICNNLPVQTLAQKLWTDSTQCRWHLHYTANTPKCGQRKISPPSLKTKFAHEVIPRPESPPAPCTLSSHKHIFKSGLTCPAGQTNGTSERLTLLNKAIYQGPGPSEARGCSTSCFASANIQDALT